MLEHKLFFSFSPLTSEDGGRGEWLFLLFFRKAANVAVGLADSLFSSVLCPNGL